MRVCAFPASSCLDVVPLCLVCGGVHARARVCVYVCVCVFTRSSVRRRATASWWATSEYYLGPRAARTRRCVFRCSVVCVYGPVVVSLLLALSLSRFRSLSPRTIWGRVWPPHAGVSPAAAAAAADECQRGARSRPQPPRVSRLPLLLLFHRQHG